MAPSAQANEFDEEMSPNCMCKIVVHEPDEKVLGFHYIGPAAGEVIHGFAIAFKMGLTKAQIEDVIAIDLFQLLSYDDLSLSDCRCSSYRLRSSHSTNGYHEV